MRKVLLATTALATVAGVAAVASADVSISGAVEWKYINVSDDEAQSSSARMSDSLLTSTHDVSVTLTETTDSGITMSMFMNIDDDGSQGTVSSSVSGDFGTIEMVEGTTGNLAGSSYDVTSVGIAGGHGDAGFTLYNGTGSSTVTVGLNEAAVPASDANTVVNYHSPSFGGFSFGIGAGDLTNADDNSSLSMGAKYTGSAGDISYTIGYANFDGVGANEEGNHVGANISWDAITFGIGSSNSQTSTTSKVETLSYSVNYAMGDGITLNVGHVNSEDSKASTKQEATNTTVGVAYTIAPGLVFNVSSHSFDYKEGGTTKNDGQAIQSELKMSF